MARTTSAVLAALIALAPAAAAFAQTDTPPAAEAPEAAAPEAAAEPAPVTAPAAPADSPAADAAPAAESAEAPRDEIVASYYTKATHGDWLLRCLRTPDGNDPCELYQLLRDEDETPVAEISVVPFQGQAAAIMNFVAPLETDLELGMGFQIDTGEAHRYPFLVCAPIGCVARVGLTEAELTSLKRGAKGTVSLLPFGGNPENNLVRLDVSLSGFTAGFTELEQTRANPEPAAE